MPRLVPLFLAVAFAACKNEIPTALDQARLPVTPVTLEVLLPWSQFATSAEVFGGFGAPRNLGAGIVANAFGGNFNAYTLLQLSPRNADSLSVVSDDSVTTLVSGTFRIRFNSGASSNQGPVAITVDRTLTHWDARTATWLLAVDSLDHQEAWPEQAGGPVVQLARGVWDPLRGDSTLISLNQAGLEAVRDSTILEFGLRMALETPGELVQVTSAELQLIASVEGLDTLINLPPVPITDLTFIYDPPPASPVGLRVGGLPAWRTVITVALPATVAGTPAACARVTCPLALTAERINHAGLVFTTQENEPAFQMIDSMLVEAVEALAPAVLPKSPLGPPMFLDDLGRPAGTVVRGAAFAPGGERTVEVPITPFIQFVAQGTTVAGVPAIPAVALLSLHCSPDGPVCGEAASISFASFAGAGQPGEPFLRLILTVSDPVELP